MFEFDGRRVPFQDGDTVGSALHRAGIHVVARSMKYHRPRGLFCCTGSCASCLVDVDGVPNLPACMQKPREGSVVRSQNRIGSAKRDALGVVDKVYRRGFDPHAAFTRPTLLNRAFLRAVRFMSGQGRVPRADLAQPSPESQPRRYALEVDEVVVGAGRHGLMRAREAAGEGRKILVLEEMLQPGGSARWDPKDAKTHALVAEAVGGSWPGVEVWTGALAFGYYDGVLAVRRSRANRSGAEQGSEDLWEVRAGRVTVASGCHDAWPLFANNDLPGVWSLRGATRMLREHGVLPGGLVVGHGGALPEDWIQDLEAAGGKVVAQGEVTAARGGSRVQSALVDGVEVACDAIVCVLPGTPRMELLQQAGCALSFGNAAGVLAPVMDEDGATNREGVFARFSLAGGDAGVGL